MDLYLQFACKLHSFETKLHSFEAWKPKIFLFVYGFYSCFLNTWIFDLSHDCLFLLFYNSANALGGNVWKYFIFFSLRWFAIAVIGNVCMAHFLFLHVIVVFYNKCDLFIAPTFVLLRHNRIKSETFYKANCINNE